MNLRKQQTGLGLIPVFLVIIVLGLIAGIGWWITVRQSDKKMDNSTTSQKSVSNFEQCVAAGNTIMETYPEQCVSDGKTFTKQTPTQQDETSVWTLYKSPGNELTMRLADGWEAERAYDDKGFLVESSQLALKPGTRAKLVDFKGGRDGVFGFYFSYGQIMTTEIPRGQKLESLKTNDGIEIVRYKFVETDPTEGIGALGKGGAEYTYIITGPKMSTRSTYDIRPTMADNHEVIEKSLKTLHFN